MKFINTNEWAVSRDGEMFYNDYNTKEDAIKACLESEAYNYIGSVCRIEFDEDDFNGGIDYWYSDMLYYEVGDAADSWKLPKENKIELNKMIGKLIADYLTEHKLQPTCFAAKNIIQVVK